MPWEGNPCDRQCFFYTDGCPRVIHIMSERNSVKSQHRFSPVDVSPAFNHRKPARSSEHRRSSSATSQLQRPSSSDRRAVTVFMIDNVHRKRHDHKPSLRSQSSSPATVSTRGQEVSFASRCSLSYSQVEARKKKGNVTFNLADNVNGSHEQRAIPPIVPCIPLPRSKAMASIQRSMNKYRFAGH